MVFTVEFSLYMCFKTLGNRGDYDLSAGPKVLLVASGGTLELHGRKKLSWTKLTKTVQKIENSGQLLYDHLVSTRIFNLSFLLACLKHRF